MSEQADGCKCAMQKFASFKRDASGRKPIQVCNKHGTDVDPASKEELHSGWKFKTVEQARSYLQEFLLLNEDFDCPGVLVCDDQKKKK